MLATIESINKVLNDFIWGVPAMACILGVGLYLSFATGFIQIRKFGYALRCTVGRIFKRGEAAEGTITPSRRSAPLWQPPSVPVMSPA